MTLKIAAAIAFLITSLSCETAKESPTEGSVPRTTPVQVGEMAPDFTLEDQNNQTVTLSSTRGMPTILVFYRGHW